MGLRLTLYHSLDPSSPTLVCTILLVRSGLLVLSLGIYSVDQEETWLDELVPFVFFAIVDSHFSEWALV
jgi:hypothetical protein